MTPQFRDVAATRPPSWSRDDVTRPSYRSIYKSGSATAGRRGRVIAATGQGTPTSFVVAAPLMAGAAALFVLWVNGTRAEPNRRR